jgi:hypothetical protein
MVMLDKILAQTKQWRKIILIQGMNVKKNRIKLNKK